MLGRRKRLATVTKRLMARKEMVMAMRKTLMRATTRVKSTNKRRLAVVDQTPHKVSDVRILERRLSHLVNDFITVQLQINKHKNQTALLLFQLPLSEARLAVCCWLSSSLAASSIVAGMTLHRVDTFTTTQLVFPCSDNTCNVTYCYCTGPAILNLDPHTWSLWG